MTNWTSWGVVGSKSSPELYAELMSIPGVLQGEDLVLFEGTLDDFSQRFQKPFTVHFAGRYLDVRLL